MKRYYHYQMDHDGKAMRNSAICMALTVFLLSVYYLFVREIGQVGVFRQIFYLWLPLVLCLAYLFLWRILRLNAPGLFAILGAALCLVLILHLFGSGNLLRILLGLCGYVFCGALLILGAGGYLPGRLIAGQVFLAILVLRLLLFHNVSGWAWLQEAADLSVLAGLSFLPVSFVDKKK